MTELSLRQFPLRETSTKAFGRLLVYKVRSDPSNTSVQLDIISSLVSALHDDSSEVRRKALSALKAVSKVFGSRLGIMDFCIIHIIRFFINGSLHCRKALHLLWPIWTLLDPHWPNVWRMEVHRWDLQQKDVLCMPSNWQRVLFLLDLYHVLQRLVNFSSDPVIEVMRCRCDSASVSCFTGPENVQAAQKFITGLDARRISKLSEHRYILVLWTYLSYICDCYHHFVPVDIWFPFSLASRVCCIWNAVMIVKVRMIRQVAENELLCDQWILPSQKWNYRKYRDKCG